MEDVVKHPNIVFKFFAMKYYLHVNERTRTIKLHASTCGHWKKIFGTFRHKHQLINSWYLTNDDKGYSLEDARMIGKGIAKKERYQYHECSFCIGTNQNLILIQGGVQKYV